MTTRITNVTTYGLDAYDADLKHIAPLSEEKRRTLLACLPTTHSATAIDSWTRGFLVGWCMAWRSQPFLDEEANEEAETLAAPVPRKRGKGTRASVPRYPNTLRSCIKQAGYSFREVSRETTIPESTLYSWASGKHVIPHASRAQLAQVIGCAAQELAPTRLGVPVSGRGNR
jgi:hypothetical protein